MSFLFFSLDFPAKKQERDVYIGIVPFVGDYNLYKSRLS